MARRLGRPLKPALRGQRNLAPGQGISMRQMEIFKIYFRATGSMGEICQPIEPHFQFAT
jgi:hypothetical protein